MGWKIVGSLNVSREMHSATLLRGSDWVFVYGGYTTVQGPVPTLAPENTAEFYNPHTGQWAPFHGPSQFCPAGATLLNDGKVLFVGGDTTNTVSFDPTNGEWHDAGTLNQRRQGGHTATLLSDGRVLVAGGTDAAKPYPDFFLASAEIYDPGTQVWTTAGDLVHRRYAHTATLLRNGKVLVVGGGGAGTLGNSAELFDPTTGQWSETASSRDPRFGHTATLLPNGEVLVAGGLTLAGNPPHDESLDSTEIYNPASQHWDLGGKLRVARRYHTATTLFDGQVLVVGGIQHDLYSGGFQKLKSTEIFDPTTRIWSLAGNLNYARSNHTATLLRSRHASPLFNVGTVLVAGGDDALEYSHSLDSAELYSSDPLQVNYPWQGNKDGTPPAHG